MLAASINVVQLDMTLDSAIGDRARRSIISGDSNSNSNISTFENENIIFPVNDSGNFDSTDGSFGQRSVRTMKPRLKIYIERYIIKS